MECPFLKNFLLNLEWNGLTIDLIIQKMVDPPENVIAHFTLSVQMLAAKQTYFTMKSTFVTLPLRIKKTRWVYPINSSYNTMVPKLLEAASQNWKMLTFM